MIRLIKIRSHRLFTIVLSVGLFLMNRVIIIIFPRVTLLELMACKERSKTYLVGKSCLTQTHNEWTKVSDSCATLTNYIQIFMSFIGIQNTRQKKFGSRKTFGMLSFLNLPICSVLPSHLDPSWMVCITGRLLPTQGRTTN